MDNKYLINALFAVSLVLYTVESQSSVLTFDDLPPATIPVGGGLLVGFIPDGYGGFNWLDSAYMNPTSSSGPSGFGNSMVSGDHIFASVGNGMVHIVERPAENFNFLGAFFTAAWHDGLSINIKGYDGLTLLYDDTFIVDTSGPTWFESEQFGINRLEFTSFGGVSNPALFGNGTNFAMDNFTFTPVPVPAGIWLFGSGIIGLVGTARRKARI